MLTDKQKKALDQKRYELHNEILLSRNSTLDEQVQSTVNSGLIDLIDILLDNAD